MVIAPPKISRAVEKSNPYRAGTPLGQDDFSAIVRQMALEGFKWDPQVGDVTTIAPFAIILRSSQWDELTNLAEQLAGELMASETELLTRFDLHKRLGLPRRLRRVLRQAPDSAPTPAAGRVLRFDFHWTDAGWQISEVNSDVPGGFTEASTLPLLMSEHYPGLKTAGNPAQKWVDTIASTARGPHIALLAATGFMEDLQITAFLGNMLAKKGFFSHLIGFQNLTWNGAIAHMRSNWHSGPLGGIIRFYQAEWLAARPMRHGWPKLFVGGDTPVANPGIATLTESKRFPLIWDELVTSLPSWRTCLPETREPRDAPWKTDDAWLVKSAWCNTGDTVCVRALQTPREWREACRSVWLRPGQWVAQRRFNALPLDTPIGLVYPCLGVYTINGRAAGIYGRFSPQPLIDFAAVDVAVLIEEEPYDR